MKFNDAEILAAIETEEQSALDLYGALAQDREEALNRYKGAPTGDEQPGRSAVVDMSIADTILWIMPSLMRIYMGGDEIGRFDARGPEDEKGAEQETKVVNWYLENRNDCYESVYSAFHDALLLRNGYIMGQWRTDFTVMTEKYQGLADEEAALLLQSKEVDVLEHTEYPHPEYAAVAGSLNPSLNPEAGAAPIPMCHDIKVERKEPTEFVAVEALPPDELLVGRRHRHTSLRDADFVQWRRRVTIGELRSEGFEVDDDTPDDDVNAEELTRDRFNRSSRNSDETADPTRRIVTFKDTYIRMDLRGKGQQQLWRICNIQGSHVVLRKEEADFIPVAGFGAVLYPHSHVGTSVYDLLKDLALIKQTLKRQLLDNVYQSNNTQTVIDITRHNVEDWLVSRPGGIKRVDGPITDSFQQLVTPPVGADILQAIEFIDSEKESRTGVSKRTTGLDATSLNTAFETRALEAAANQRIELIALTLAGGFRDLMLIMHALVCKHSTKPLQIKLDNEWQVIDPREWTQRTDFILSVGLGAGTPEQRAHKLVMAGPLIQQAQQIGTEESYNWGVEVLRSLGYKNTQRFLRPPERGPDGKVIPPQPPPPEAVLVEQERQKGAAMLAQAKHQADAQLKQLDAMVKQKELELNAMLKKIDQEGALALQQSNDQRQSALDQQKADLESRFKDAELQVKVQIANISAASASEVARINHGMDDGTAMLLQQAHAAGYAPVLDKLDEVAKLISAPKRIVRGPDGKVAGSEMVPPETMQ